MRYFLGKVEESPIRGYNRRIRVYTIKKNIVNIVDTVDVHTASYPGDEATVLHTLYEHGLISQKDFEFANGYYTWTLKGERGISIQVL